MLRCPQSVQGPRCLPGCWRDSRPPNASSASATCSRARRGGLRPRLDRRGDGRLGAGECEVLALASRATAAPGLEDQAARHYAGRSKAQEFDQTSLEYELADGLLVTSLLAEIFGVDIARAVCAKVQAIDA